MSLIEEIIMMRGDYNIVQGIPVIWKQMSSHGASMDVSCQEDDDASEAWAS